MGIVVAYHRSVVARASLCSANTLRSSHCTLTTPALIHLETPTCKWLTSTMPQAGLHLGKTLPRRATLNRPPRFTTMLALYNKLVPTHLRKTHTGSTPTSLQNIMDSLKDPTTKVADGVDSPITALRKGLAMDRPKAACTTVLLKEDILKATILRTTDVVAVEQEQVSARV